MQRMRDLEAIPPPPPGGGISLTSELQAETALFNVQEITCQGVDIRTGVWVVGWVGIGRAMWEGKGGTCRPTASRICFWWLSLMEVGSMETRQLTRLGKAPTTYKHPRRCY